MTAIGPITSPIWTPYARTVLKTAGLVSLWPLDEPTGTNARDAKGASPATFAGTATRGSLNPLASEAGASTKFDGATAYASAADVNALDLGDTFSIEMMLRYGVLATERLLLTKGTGGGYGVKITTTGKVRLTQYGVGDGKFGVNALNDSAWHHVVLTRASGTEFVYVDGLDVSSGTATASPYANTAIALFIGAADAVPNFAFDGNMAWLAVYNVALSAAVAAQHNAARVG